MRTHVKIVADSLSPQGKRIVSIELVYPRIIHAEVMTHRVFSRNAASSRAIPSAKLIQSVKDDPFIPIAFQKKHSGMQGTEYLTGEDAEYAAERWLKASRAAIEQVQLLTTFHGITKQLANRILEPFQYYKVLVTSTEWENFFELRCPKYEFNDQFYKSWKDLGVASGRGSDDEYLDSASTIERLTINRSQADIHISELAEKIWDAMNESKPEQLEAGQWHIPYGNNIESFDLLPYLDYTGFDINRPLSSEIQLIKVKIATARAARVSYTVLDSGAISGNYNSDIQLHDRLLESKHMSPFEHCARAMSDEEYYSHASGLGYNRFDEEANCIYFEESNMGWCRNFRGFIQYRSIAEGVPTELDQIGGFE